MEVQHLGIAPAIDLLKKDFTDKQPGLRGSIRILVADDHEAARKALVQILSLTDDFDVVGEAIDGLDAVDKGRRLLPDVILMDVSMPGLNGVEASRSIMTELSGVNIIGLSTLSRNEMEAQMLAAGAVCYLQKLTPVAELFAAIRDARSKRICY